MFSLSCLDQCHVNTPAGTLRPITVSVCPRCGTIEKSGKMSCCGRGGSWFDKCGSAGNAKNHHTWSEGIQACKARSQSKVVIGQRLDFAQQKGIDSFQGVGMTKYKAVIPATKMFVFTSFNTSIPDTASIVTSTYTPDNIPITTSAGTSIITQGCLYLLKTSTQISILRVCLLVCLSYA